MGRYILRAMLNFQGVHGFDVINQRHPLLDHSEYASVCIHPRAQIAGDFQYLVLEISNMHMFAGSHIDVKLDAYLSLSPKVWGEANGMS